MGSVEGIVVHHSRQLWRIFLDKIRCSSLLPFLHFEQRLIERRMTTLFEGEKGCERHCGNNSVLAGVSSHQSI
jgi:hypothetical protein